MTRLIVLQHEAEAPLGLLTRPDLPTHTVHAYRGDEVPGATDGMGGLVVLGGGMNAYADAEHPWLTPTKNLIRQAVADGTPTLLLCLGHQLGAVAMGGRVEVGTSLGPLWGTAPMGLTEEGVADPLLGRLDDARVIHWNSDVVADTPPGAVVLARDPRGAVQALRYGERAWSIQAHPEADADIVQAWADKQDADMQEQAQAALTDVRRHGPAIATAWRPVLDAFLDLVLQR
ncbi:MAG: type 1 glutamine amidotransferase [Mobilicoccus sp.]|nr:type 1 glutamine amidotransferase [Mobilicoccus sp.]